MNGLVSIVDGFFGDEHCSEPTSWFITKDHRAPWLRIDFGKWKSVQFVEIHNRITTLNNPMERISGTKVYVYGETQTDNRRLCGEISQGGEKVYYMVCFNQPLIGKGIELVQYNKNEELDFMNLCQVIVLGY